MKITLEERVYNYMKEFGSISSMQAFQDLGVTRLSAAIFGLKKKGHHIVSRTETAKNRYGSNTSYSVYWLEE